MTCTSFLPGKFTWQKPWFNISATLIRERLEHGEPCDDLMPDSVLDYINQQGLYR